MIIQYQKLINAFVINYRGRLIYKRENNYHVGHNNFPTLQAAKAYIDKPIKLKIA